MMMLPLYLIKAGANLCVPLACGSFVEDVVKRIYLTGGFNEPLSHGVFWDMRDDSEYMDDMTGNISLLTSWHVCYCQV